MKRLAPVLLLWMTVHCHAQIPCDATVETAAKQLQGIQGKLKQVVGAAAGGPINVPAPVSDELTRFKDVLSCVADLVLAHEAPSVEPVALQQKLADILNANRPDEPFGYYGHNLRVRVSRPANRSALLEVEFSVNIECGNDDVLLIYALNNGAWTRLLRWQAPPLQKISDAFGDFFLSALLSEDGNSALRIVVAHGTPWCLSRFSRFQVDILSPGSDPNSPKLVWHTERNYSRGGFLPTLESSGNTFELQLNDSTMDALSYERRVIYRYHVDEHQGVRRIEPIAADPRGFVEEWLSAPWAESESFSAQSAGPAMRLVHDQFAPPTKLDTDFATHTYGPVRACAAPGMLQVEIDSTLNKIIPGKPDVELQPLPSHYFHVREIKDGYLMVSAPTEPDPACGGADLMPR